MKKTISILLFACAILLSSCGATPGQLPDNLTSAESTGDDSPSYVVAPDKDRAALLQTYRKAVINKASTLMEGTAPEIDEIGSFSELVDLVNKYKSETFSFNSTLYENRKNSFVVLKGEVKNTDIVNVTITQYDSAESDNASGLDTLTYDIDLSKNDSDIGKAIIAEKKEVGGKVHVENCKLPDGKTAKITAEINYCTRVATDDDLNGLISSFAEGKTYKDWLAEAQKASGVVDVIWDYLESKVQFKGLDTDADYQNYLDIKLTNAIEYYKLYPDIQVDENVLKETIEAQIKREILVYYYKEQLLDEVDIPDAGKDILDSKTESAIIAYYGYTEKSFEKKYDQTTVDSTLEVDGLNYRLYKLYFDSIAE